MSDLNVRDMLDTVTLVHVEGDPIDTQDLDLHTVEDTQAMVALWRDAKRQADAARQVLDTCGVRLAELLGDGGAAAIGPNIVRYGVGYTERCIDPEGFARFITDQIHQARVDVGEVVNVNYVKKSWMDPAVRDTFFEKVDDEHPKLQVVPRDRAPKFLQGLGDGEVKAGKR